MIISKQIATKTAVAKFMITDDGLAQQSKTLRLLQPSFV